MVAIATVATTVVIIVATTVAAATVVIVVLSRFFSKFALVHIVIETFLFLFHSFSA